MGQLKVCMFVYNDCKHDSRVLREAKALAEAGYEVRIIALLDKETDPFEKHYGFLIVRVPKDPLHYRLLRHTQSMKIVDILLIPYKHLANRIKNLRRRVSNTVLQKLPRKKDALLPEPLGRPLATLLGLVYYSVVFLKWAWYWMLRRPYRFIRARAHRVLYLLRKRAHRVLYLLRKRVHRVLYLLRKRTHRVLYLGVRVLMLKVHRPFSFIDYYKRAFEIVKREPADIYHAHDLNTLPVAYWAARRLGGKLVYDSHELYVERNRPIPFSRIGKRLERTLEAFLIRRSHAVITVNESIAKELARRYKIPMPTVIMNCPEASDSIIASKPYIREALGVDKETPIILYQGGFAPNRGLEELIVAMKYVNSGILVLMGWGKIEPQLRALAASLSLLGSRVFFLPPVPPSELLAWTSSADVGLVPIPPTCLSYYYTLPNKFFEYIAAGVPVVASDLPELRRIIQEYNIGLTFTPGDPQDVARAINGILGTKEILMQLRENVRNAAQFFRWENEKQKLLKLYQELEI